MIFLNSYYNLCIQTVYNLGLINNILYSYKNIFSYEENISYNELPIIIFEKDNYSILNKRSSAIVYNENDTYNNFIVRDSILPSYSKRNSDVNLTSLNLRITKGNSPVDNHLLIKKRNPLEDHIFDFESSDDDFDDLPAEGKVDKKFSHFKSKTFGLDNI